MYANQINWKLKKILGCKHTIQCTSYERHTYIIVSVKNGYGRNYSTKSFLSTDIKSHFMRKPIYASIKSADWCVLVHVCNLISINIIISSPSGKFCHVFCCLLILFKINFSEKFFQEYHLSVKQIGSRSGPTFCRAWSGSNLFAKAMSRRHL